MKGRRKFDKKLSGEEHARQREWLRAKALLWNEYLCAPQNAWVEALPPNVMVFGRRAFGRPLGLDEVRRVKPP